MSQKNDNPPAEIRVHGIGDHRPYDALGKPVFEELTKDWISVANGPPNVLHHLRLINWSRSSRRRTSTLLWYLALPFTIANVAANMRPDTHQRLGGWGDLAFRLLMAIPGLCLTSALTIWMVAISETTLISIGIPTDSTLVRVIICILPSIVLGFALLARLIFTDLRRNCEFRNWLWGIYITNVALLGALAAFLVISSRDSVEANVPTFGARQRILDTGISIQVIAITTGIVVLIALVLAVISTISRIGRRYFDTAGTHLAGAALLILLSIAILHTAGSIIRSIVETVFEFILEFLVPFGLVSNETLDRRQSAFHAQTNLIVVPAPNRGHAIDINRLDTLPVFLVALVLVSLVVLKVALSISRRNIPKRAGRDHEVGKLPETAGHSILADVNSFLGLAILASVVGSVAIWIWLAQITFFSTSEWFTLVAYGVRAAIFICIIALVSRWPRRLSRMMTSGFNKFADVAGFWPPDAVAFAGASYRRSLIDGLQAEIEKHNGAKFALVGHSQGSVASAWYISRRLDRSQMGNILFITCGSPLITLYATFFPRHFNNGFFAKVALSCEGRWVNYFRMSDTISSRIELVDGEGTAVQYADNVNVTAAIDGIDEGHGNYWIEKKFIKKVQDFIDEEKSPEVDDLAMNIADRFSTESSRATMTGTFSDDVGGLIERLTVGGS